MEPILLSVGPVVLYSYPVALTVAFVAGWAIARWYLPKVGVAPGVAVELVLAALIGGIVGARLLYVLDHLALFEAHPWQVFMLQLGGLTFYGGLAGGVLVVVFYAHRRGLPLPVVADAAALALPLGAAIGRVGCLLNGCCYGVSTAGWFGVDMPQPIGRVVPTQLLDSAYNLAIFAVLLIVATRRRPAGGTMWWAFLLMYGVARFAIESLRMTPSVTFGLTEAQLVSVPLALAGALGLYRSLRSGPGRGVMA